MTKLFKLTVIWFIIGSFYFVLEGIWRIPQGGYANIVMLPIGGICGILVGGINQIPRFYNMKVLWQALLGTALVLFVELCSGIVVNVWLGMNIWNYSDMPFNVMGQISLPFGILWFLLIPFGIWLEDSIRYELWREGSPYGPLAIYKELFTYK